MVRVSGKSTDIKKIKKSAGYKKIIAEVTKYVSKEDNLEDLPNLYVKTLRTAVKRAELKRNKSDLDIKGKLLDQFYAMSKEDQKSMNLEYVARVIKNMYLTADLKTVDLVYFNNPYKDKRPNDKSLSFYKDLVIYTDNVVTHIEEDLCDNPTIKQIEDYADNLDEVDFVNNDLHLNDSLLISKLSGYNNAINKTMQVTVAGKYMVLDTNKLLKCMLPLYKARLSELKFDKNNSNHKNVRNRIEINKILKTNVANVMLGYVNGMSGARGALMSKLTKSQELKDLHRYITKKEIGDFRRSYDKISLQEIYIVRIEDHTSNYRFVINGDDSGPHDKYITIDPKTFKIAQGPPEGFTDNELDKLFNHSHRYETPEIIID